MSLISGRMLDSDSSGVILGDPEGTLGPFPSAAGSLTIESDSVNDQASGPGAMACLVELVYEKTGPRFDIIKAEIPTDGVTPVTCSAEHVVFPVGFQLDGVGVRRVRIFGTGGIDDPGSSNPGETPAGNMVAKIDGAEVSRITQGRGVSEILTWTTGPKRSEVLTFFYPTLSIPSPPVFSDIELQLWFREILNDQGWKPVLAHVANTGVTCPPLALPTPLAIPLMCDLQMVITNPSATDADSRATMEIVYRDGLPTS